jgi:hypothetical protein
MRSPSREHPRAPTSLFSLKYGLPPLSPCSVRLVTVFRLPKQHEAIDVSLRGILERGDVESFVERFFRHSHCQWRKRGEPFRFRDAGQLET